MCFTERTLCRARLLAFAILCTTGLVLVTHAQAPPATPPTISLQDAIQRAQLNEPAFAASVAAQRSAAIDRYIAKAALLPSVTYHNQMLYTEPNGQTNQGGQAGTQQAPIFIANNAIHEYMSQASIDERVGLKQFADARIFSANAARAGAEMEVARRGLVSAVVNLYVQVSATEVKRGLLTQALQEAVSFTDLTEKRESAREVARADVVKAQLQQQQRERDLRDAVLMAERARLELAVLLFPDPRTPYSIQTPGVMPALPTRDEVNRMASTGNPEIRSALADVQASNAGVVSAKAAYLPDLTLNFTYGIDAPQFAKNGPDGVRNLGYSISGTLDIPVWDWLATQKRVKQSEIRRDVAKINLTSAQRRLIATLEEVYAEASAAQAQLDLLDQSVRTAAESLRLTKLRYAAGEATALEVVDAQTSYLTAETSQADGTVRYQSAVAQLQLLTGTL
jgi:outer membrane protein TolC